MTCHRFESCWSPDIFQASSFQLLKLENLLRSLLFTFIYNRSTIWISYIFHIISLHGKIWTQQIDLAPNAWLHSSVGWASHLYRGGHGFESRWSLDIFLASSFQLLNWKIYCNDHSSLSSTTAVQYDFHIYISQYQNTLIIFNKPVLCWDRISQLPMFLSFYQAPRQSLCKGGLF